MSFMTNKKGGHNKILKKIHFFCFSFFCFLVLTLFVSPVSAAVNSTGAPELNVPIPGLSFSPTTTTATSITTDFLSKYIDSLYRFLLGVSIAIAIVMIMIGGLQYAFGAVSPGQIEKGKERIQNGVIGLVLLLCSGMLLFIVNPQLTFLNSISLFSIKPYKIDLSAMETNVNPGGGFDELSTANISGSGFNNVPVFKQAGGSWGKTAYGPLQACPGGTENSTCCTTYAYAGCGPTSLAMILRHQGFSVDPGILGKFATSINARVCNKGTNIKIIQNINKFDPNLKYKQLRYSAAMELLSGPNPIPVMVTTPDIPGCYKTGGHWIVLTGVDENGNIRVNDPASGRCFKNRSNADGFFGEGGAGLTGMTPENAKKLSGFWVITDKDTFSEKGL